MAEPIPVTLKFDEDKYNEDKRKLIIKMTLPASWASKPVKKIIKHYIKKFNDSNPESPIKADDCRLIVDREQCASARVHARARAAAGARAAPRAARAAGILSPTALIGPNVKKGDELTISLKPEHTVHPADIAEAERLREKSRAEAEEVFPEA